MRVQRAPGAADQPQRPPAGFEPRTDVVTGSRAASPAEVPAASFSADVDLDLTMLLKGRDESQVVAEILVRLVAACRDERVLDVGSTLRVVRPTREGLVGVQLGPAVELSAYAISSGLGARSSPLPDAPPGTLTVVDLSGTRVRASGDWGLGGLGVVTLGRIEPTVASHRQTSAPGFTITQRLVARLGFTVPSCSAAAGPGVVRALDSVARSVEGLDG